MFAAEYLGAVPVAQHGQRGDVEQVQVLARVANCGLERCQRLAKVIDRGRCLSLHDGGPALQLQEDAADERDQLAGGILHRRRLGKALPDNAQALQVRLQQARLGRNDDIGDGTFQQSQTDPFAALGDPRQRFANRKAGPT
jgi:hypothetical protein